MPLPIETEFTPVASAVGGALIGLAAGLLMLMNGRIAGISGILGRLIMPTMDSKPAQALAFVVGIIAAPLLWTAVLDRSVAQTLTDNLLLAAIAGLLVGFGAAYGGGCTSGHGVCGLARLSPRSVVATAIFMTTAILVVFVSRHLIGGGP
ncbi:MAG: YeeE/YedE thiosulfate transporter family protein [Hyphomicrobium sp.]